MTLASRCQKLVCVFYSLRHCYRERPSLSFTLSLLCQYPLHWLQTTVGDDDDNLDIGYALLLAKLVKLHYLSDAECRWKMQRSSDDMS